MNESIEEFWKRLEREGKYANGNLTLKGRVWLMSFEAESALKRKLKGWK